ncbi:hypothetical protein L211DRAFT_145529 [Terfezia boudieri ATCC MYA-4762]|uniref:Uncharacterized protein n=1 Tax=Terfezia boudieri ATCC MYA-4762 TaxID=1051890 RepID=A0A3N4LPB1_9PEZI|nr:hypothetical protein L211DRAFT_145529 [Terfezia boudieri ATCC MYA-4762]
MNEGGKKSDRKSKVVLTDRIFSSFYLTRLTIVMLLSQVPRPNSLSVHATPCSAPSMRRKKIAGKQILPTDIDPFSPDSRRYTKLLLPAQKRTLKIKMRYTQQPWNIDYRGQ